MSCVIRKPTFYIGKNKGPDRRLCFCYTDSTTHLLSKSKVCSLQPSAVAVLNLLGNSIVCFLMMQLMCRRNEYKIVISRQRKPNDTDQNVLYLYFSVITYQKKLDDLSRIMTKLDFCICENKAADQLCSNCTADQRL